MVLGCCGTGVLLSRLLQSPLSSLLAVNESLHTPHPHPSIQCRKTRDLQGCCIFSVTLSPP